MITAAFKKPYPWKASLVFFILGLIFIIFRTTLWINLDSKGYGPDLILILSVYLGLFFFPVSGALMAVFFGLLTDVVSGGPQGLYTGIYLVNFGAAVLIRKKLDPASPFYQFLIILLLALLSECLMWSALSFINRPIGNLFSPFTLSRLAIHLSSILSTALVSPVCFWLFHGVWTAEEFRPGDMV